MIRFFQSCFRFRKPSKFFNTTIYSFWFLFWFEGHSWVVVSTRFCARLSEGWEALGSLRGSARGKEKARPAVEGHYTRPFTLLGATERRQKVEVVHIKLPKRDFWAVFLRVAERCRKPKDFKQTLQFILCSIQIVKQVLNAYVWDVPIFQTE